MMRLIVLSKRISGVDAPAGMSPWRGECVMNENHVAGHQQPQAFHGIRHREIGLRAVAAAILYQGGGVERTSSHELSAPPVAVTPSSDHES
jgi:hypothetical protein